MRTTIANVVLQAQRDAVANAVRSWPDMTLAEFAKVIHEMGSTATVVTLGDITGPSDRPKQSSALEFYDDLAKARARRKKAAKESGNGSSKTAKWNGKRLGKAKALRSKTARDAYDKAIIVQMKKVGKPLRTTDLAGPVGGTDEQLRSALRRLGKAKLVKRKGERNKTRYELTARK